MGWGEFGFQAVSVAAALPDERWAQLQDSFGQLHALLGSIETKSEQMVLQIDLTSKLLNQAANGQQFTVKQLEGIGQTLMKLTFPMKSKAGDGFAPTMLDTPVPVPKWELGTSGVLFSLEEGMLRTCLTEGQPGLPREVKMFAEIPQQESAHQKFEGTSSTLLGLQQEETEARSAAARDLCVQLDMDLSMRLDGTEYDMHQEVPRSTITGQTLVEMQDKEVVWDNELIHNIDSHDALLQQLVEGSCEWDDLPTNQDIHHGLLQQLAMGAEYCVDDKNTKDSANVVLNGMSSQEVADGMCDEMLGKVVWDGEVSSELDMTNDLLQVLASGGEYPLNDQVADCYASSMEFRLVDADHAFVEKLEGDSKTDCKTSMGDELTLERNTPFLIGVAVDHVNEIVMEDVLFDAGNSLLNIDSCMQEMNCGHQNLIIFDGRQEKASAQYVIAEMPPWQQNAFSPRKHDMELSDQTFKSVLLVGAYMICVKNKIPCLSIRQWDPGIFRYLAIGLAREMARISTSLPFSQHSSEIFRLQLVQHSGQLAHLMVKLFLKSNAYHSFALCLLKICERYIEDHPVLWHVNIWFRLITILVVQKKETASIEEYAMQGLMRSTSWFSALTDEWAHHPWDPGGSRYTTRDRGEKDHGIKSEIRLGFAPFLGSGGLLTSRRTRRRPREHLPVSIRPSTSRPGLHHRRPRGRS